MQIIQPGFVPKRAKADTVVNPTSPVKPVRVRLTRDCVVWTGCLGKADDVYEFDASTPEGFEAVAMLTGHSSAGVKVPLSTKLLTQPATPPPLATPAPEQTAPFNVEQFAQAMLKVFREGLQQPRPTKG